jgi:hypothetical protein
MNKPNKNYKLFLLILVSSISLLNIIYIRTLNSNYKIGEFDFVEHDSLLKYKNIHRNIIEDNNIDKHVHYVYNYDEGLNRFERILEYQTKDSDYLTRFLNYKLNNNDMKNSIKYKIFFTFFLFHNYFITIINKKKRTIQQQISRSNSDFIMFIDLETSQNYETFLDELKTFGVNYKSKNNQFVLVNLAYNQLDLSKYSTFDLKLTQFSLIDYTVQFRNKLISP